MAEISPVAFDATIRHATYLERLKAGQARSITPMLREIDEELRKRLSKGDLTNLGRARLERLLEATDKQLKGILDNFGFGFTKELRDLATIEAGFEASTLDAAIQDPNVETTVPSSKKVVAAAMSSPLQVEGIHGGKLLGPFIKDWSTSQRNLLTGIIRKGSVQGLTNQEIVRQIRGNAKLGFRNGALAMTRNQSTAMVRTAVSHVSHAARMATFEANSKYVKRYRWLSTLDNRTSEICQGLSGEEFPVGEGPVPPAHVNCRSTIVAVLEGEFAEELRKGRKQASQFGPVDAKENYFDWMKRQPAEFQNQAIGPVKARLLRRGGLSGEEFRRLTRADNFRPLTLAEMAKLNPEAFKKAGIQIGPTGRPFIPGSRTANIRQNIPPPPKPKPTTKPASNQAKPSLAGPGVPAKKTEDFLKWEGEGTFSTTRIKPIADAADAPGQIAAGKSGAYYSSGRGIHMGAKEADRGNWFAKDIYRHEWGHYLDDILGGYAGKTDSFLGPILKKVAGSGPTTYQNYISSWKKPAAALKATKKHLETMGKRIVKLGDPFTKKRIFQHDWIELGWEARASQLTHEAKDLAPAARTYLKKSDHLLAKVWRRLQEQSSTSMLDDVLLAEAAKADDISVLFRSRGYYLGQAMRQADGSDGGWSALSDMMGAATKESIGGYNTGFGHGKTYYKNRGFHGQATEAFANMTSIEQYRRSDALVDEIVRAFMPEFSGWYDELLDELNKIFGG